MSKNIDDLHGNDLSIAVALELGWRWGRTHDGSIIVPPWLIDDSFVPGDANEANECWDQYLPEYWFSLDSTYYLDEPRFLWETYETSKRIVVYLLVGDGDAPADESVNIKQYRSIVNLIDFPLKEQAMCAARLRCLLKMWRGEDDS